MGGANGDSSIWSAFGTGGYDNEPPLLEELGIHFDAIKAKQEPSPSPSLSGSSSSGQEVSKDDDDDLVGPVMFLLVLGASLLLRGKVAFQSVYSLYLLGVFAIFCILNLMNTHPEGIAWSRTMSILGYSLLPMVFLSCIAIVLPCSNSSSSSSVFGLSLAGAVVVAWCTVISTSAFVRTLHMNEQRLLVAYPIGLFYTCFALMTVY
ncbi:hypothetical protein BX666DRAFT_1857583 [Dichotomocladium elegans]|nr:hypothetical protein BX666DRAFT_1857583 [Dichotomocladium elegans]